MPDIGCPRLEVLLEENKEIKKLYNSDDEFKEVWDDAIALQDCINSLSVHACYLSGCFVTTFNGLKDIKDIEIGDLVLTHDGTYKPVVNKTINRSNDVYRVRTGSTGEFYVTGNHPIGYSNIIRKPGWDPKNKTYCQLTNVSDFSYKQVKDLDINSDFLKMGISKLSRIPSEDDYPGYNLPWNNPDFWWICGLYLADGWREFVKRRNKNDSIRYDHRLFICCEFLDSEVEEISRRLDSCGIKYKINKARTCYKFYIHVSGSKIFEYFGTFGDGCHNKCPNGDIFNLPVEFLQEYLSGYFYGDGSYDEKRRAQSFHTVSRKLAVSLPQLIFKAYKQTCSIYFNAARNGNIEGRDISCSDSWKGSFIWNPEVRVNGIFHNNDLFLKIKELEKIDGEYDVYNLTVLDNSTYVINNHITHNCGVILSDDPLTDQIPLWDSKGTVVTQYDGPTLEKLGFVKLDILGLQTLTILNDAAKLIKKNHGVDIDYYSMPVDDPETYKTISTSNNLGVFQIEGAGISAFANACQPKNIHDIAMILSAYRPGPMNIDGLLSRVAGKIRGDVDDTDFVFSKYNYIFENSYGEILYQEGFMRLSMDMCGFTEIEADTLRKATGKICRL